MPCLPWRHLEFESPVALFCHGTLRQPISNAPRAAGYRNDPALLVAREAERALAVIADEQIAPQRQPRLAPQRQRSIGLCLHYEDLIVGNSARATRDAGDVPPCILSQRRCVLRLGCWYPRCLGRVERIQQRLLDAKAQIAAFAVVDDEKPRALLRHQREQCRESSD